MRARYTAGAAVTAVAMIASGCGANIPTELTKAPAGGVAGHVGDVAVRDLFVLGSGPDGTLAAGGAAPVYFTIVGKPAVQQTMNAGGSVEPEKGGDVLRNVTSPDAASSRLTAGPIAVPNGRNVKIGPAATVLLEGLKRPLTPADNVKITLSFQDSGARTFDVPVLPPNSYWRTYEPAPAPASTG